MKGVALDICPEITFVDITHDIAPYDTLGGALELAASYKHFPSGTIFLVVIDPGVGSPRRAIAAEAGSYRFVGPDNGVLSLALNEISTVQVVELTNARYARPMVSRTFEGRDRFAPAAAWLARGAELAEFGSPLAAWTQLAIPTPTIVAGRVNGEILRVDRFGNLVSNLDRRMVEHFAQGRGIEVAVGGRVVGSLVTTYADAAPGSVCALCGSSEHLEVAVSGGSAAELLGVARGATVTLSRV
jgi:S-adenosylmethionine hydrolase